MRVSASVSFLEEGKKDKTKKRKWSGCWMTAGLSLFFLSLVCLLLFLSHASRLILWGPLFSLSLLLGFPVFFFLLPIWHLFSLILPFSSLVVLVLGFTVSARIFFLWSKAGLSHIYLLSLSLSLSLSHVCLFASCIWVSGVGPEKTKKEKSKERKLLTRNRKKNGREGNTHLLPHGKDCYRGYTGQYGILSCLLTSPAWMFRLARVIVIVIDDDVNNVSFPRTFGHGWVPCFEWHGRSCT